MDIYRSNSAIQPDCIGRSENRPACQLVFARLQNYTQYKRRASPDALFTIFVVVQIFPTFNEMLLRL